MQFKQCVQQCLCTKFKFIAIFNFHYQISHTMQFASPNEA